jgi:signal transduction histidine kinase
VALIEDPVTTSTGAPAPAALDASPQRLRSLARAAQHDILRRLTPPLRHDMVVHLQSLGMMAEALSARMERGAAKTDDLGACVSKLNRLSRLATARCLDVCTWMEPAEDDTVSLREGVNEVVRLLSTSLNFRGFDLRTEPGEGQFDVCRSALRFLLAGAILTLTDAAPAPGEIVVRVEQSSSHGVIAAEYQAQPEGGFTQPHESGEAPLSWVELQALALQYDVELLRNGQAIILRLPRAVVTTPLKMVPV